MHFTGSFCLPSDFSCIFVDRSDELDITSVHVKDQQIVPDCRRPARSVFVHDPQILISPQYFSRLHVQTGRAVGPVLKKHFTTLDDGCRGSVAVGLMHPLRIFLLQYLDVFDNLAGLFIDTDCIDSDFRKNNERLTAGVGFQAFLGFLLRSQSFVRCCDPNLISYDERGRPTPARQVRAPSDVFGLAPFGRYLGRIGHALTTRPTPLRPITRMPVWDEQTQRIQ